MKYMGSKNRYAKEILPIILKDRKPDQWYVEPFVGGANIIDKVNGNRIGSDNNYYLISLLWALQDGWYPPKELSEEEYKKIKNIPSYFDPALVGFVGIPCSYAAKWFGGYCRGFDSKGFPRNYIIEARNNCLKQAPELSGIHFKFLNYIYLDIPDQSIIYCDPPYKGTTKYSTDFDHAIFWDWVRGKSIEGHDVFVSEYEAPEDFEVLWEKKVYNSLDKNTGGKMGIEKLWGFKK